jgi:hypothetical protein
VTALDGSDHDLYGNATLAANPMLHPQLRDAVAESLA